jgi:putative iron-dependent peroxidase
MPIAQSGIFALGTGSHAYLEFTLRPAVAPIRLARAVADLREPRTTTGGVNLVVGFRPSLWEQIAPSQAPAGVAEFAHDLQGANEYSIPATQHDLWLWVAGHAYGKVPP